MDFLSYEFSITFESKIVWIHIALFCIQEIINSGDFQSYVDCRFPVIDYHHFYLTTSFPSTNTVGNQNTIISNLITQISYYSFEMSNQDE